MLLSNRLAKQIASICLLFIIHSAYSVEIEPQLEKATQFTPNLEAGKKRYVLCAACHGDDGHGQQGGEFPSIAGQHQNVMLKQIMDIRAKKRINPTMYPFVDLQTLGGIQGMVDVVAYTASLDSGGERITGSGDNLKRGEHLYAKLCAACHGEQGEGNNELYYPRINKQHYLYLVRELTWIRDKVRKNANPAMVKLLQVFTKNDILAVADYLSRL